METLSFSDRLESLGTVVGVLLVLFALGFLAGQPWGTESSTLALLLKLVGVGLLAALGAFLVRVSRAG